MLRSEENLPHVRDVEDGHPRPAVGVEERLATRSWHSPYDWKSASSMYVSCSSSE